MGEATQPQLHISGQDNEAPSPKHPPLTHRSPSTRLRNCKWWLRISFYTMLVFSTQAVATLLGRLYYERGGNSKWLATLVVTLGFPLVIPFYLYSPTKPPNTKAKSLSILAFIYISLGILVTTNSYLYSIGLLYLPVSTYSLICATQLAFNAIFSFFLNSQKFTPYIVNSLVLITISATILVFHSDSSDPHRVSKLKYTIGFLSTVGASALFSLTLSLTQLAFQKVIKDDGFVAILDMILYPGVAATCASIVGLFASGEWKGLKMEMESFELGKFSYVMVLTWTAISWEAFSIGSIGLIFELSSLFCNAVGAFSLPIIPILAVIFFHDKMDGLKVIAMLLAIWGFVSYVYQQYLDSLPYKAMENKDVNEVPELV